MVVNSQQAVSDTSAFVGVDVTKACADVTLTGTGLCPGGRQAVQPQTSSNPDCTRIGLGVPRLYAS